MDRVLIKHKQGNKTNLLNGMIVMIITDSTIMITIMIIPSKISKGNLKEELLIILLISIVHLVLLLFCLNLE